MMTPSTKGSKKPAVTLSKVPSVRELCERLGFQHASLKDTNAFMDTTHAWRKAYKTSNGTSGTELLLWNAVWVQLDLTRMAECFLEENGNGDRFWSASRSWNHDSEVQYPDDRPRIIELLKQLFWKQNRYAANNNAYAHKGVESRDGSHERITSRSQTVRPTPYSSADPISQQEASSSTGTPPATGEPPIAGFFGQVEDGPSKATTAMHVTGTSDQVVGLPSEKDIYEISDDDNCPTKVTDKLPTSPAQPSRPSKTKRTATPRDNTSRKKTKYNLDGSRRRTDRKRMRPDRPGIVTYVSDDLYEESRKTPPPIQDPLLGPGLNLLKRSSDEQDDTSGEPLAQAPGLKEPFTAPTAPMVVPNQTHHPSKTSTGSAGPLEPPRSVSKSKSQAKPSSPITQSSKVVRLSVKEIKTAQIPFQDTSIIPAVQGIATPETRRTIPTEHASIQQSITQKDEVSPRDPNTCDTTSPSTPKNSCSEPGKSSAGPLIADEGNISTSATRYTSRGPAEDQETSKAVATEASTNNGSQDPSQLLKVYPDERSSLAENGPSKDRVKTQVPLWIITREPRYTEERWNDGKFQGAQLSEFLEDVSKATQRDHIEKLKLTLQTPTFDTKITVFKGDEVEWASAKKTFVEKLKMAMAVAKSSRSNEPASFKILIEPFYEEIPLMSSSNVDEDDVEFAF